MTVDDRQVATVEFADSYARRARGMLFRRDLPEGLLLRPCRSVHGVMMSTMLDIAFLDRSGRVLRTAVLRPYRLLSGPRGTHQTLEAIPGSFRRWRLHEGSVVRFFRGHDDRADAVRGAAPAVRSSR